MKLYRRWSTVYFPWLIDNKWELVGYCVDQAAADSLIAEQQALTGLTYQYKVTE